MASVPARASLIAFFQISLISYSLAQSPPPSCQSEWESSVVEVTVPYELGSWGGAGADFKAQEIVLSRANDIKFRNIPVFNYRIYAKSLQLIPNRFAGRAEFRGIHWSTPINLNAMDQTIRVRPHFYADQNDFGWFGTITAKATSEALVCPVGLRQ